MSAQPCSQIAHELPREVGVADVVDCRSLLPEVHLPRLPIILIKQKLQIMKWLLAHVVFGAGMRADSSRPAAEKGPSIIPLQMTDDPTRVYMLLFYYYI